MNKRTAWIECLALALCLCALLWGQCALAAGDKAGDITKKCSIKVSEGTKSKLTDGNVRTTWSYEHTGAYVGIKLPKDAEAGWLRVEWMYDPTGYELVEFDSSMNQLRQRDQTCTFPNIYSMYELLPETEYIELKMTARDQKVCTVAVYSAGELPSDVQVWEPPVEKADLMVVSTHQDDELIFLGGTIPYYATALKKPTIVVYMTNCTRYRRNEALNALWKMGVRNYPEFINLEDKKVDSINEGIRLWGGKDNILSLVAERIRRFKPEVIVTQDLNGEYGHNQHKITARSIMYAIEAAADPAQYPESAERYGEWQVKKLYHHLYKKNQIEMDWEKPLDSLKGHTALEVAQLGMNEHASQLKYYAVKSHGTYDNSKFGLYYTTVGEDVAKDDFLENIDPDASAKYLEEHAEEIAARKAAAEAAAAATPEPTQAPTPEPTEAPVAQTLPEEDSAVGAAPEAVAPEPAPTVVPVRTAEKGGSTALAVAMIALGVAAVGAGGWYGWRTLSGGRRRRRRSKRR